MPSWIGSAPSEYQSEILQGLIDGDGCDVGSGIRLTLANPTLAYEATLLANTLGYDAAFTKNAEHEMSQKPTSKCYINRTESKSSMNNVLRREGDEIEVYDMEVADDHSFVVGNFVVHNCFVYHPGDSLIDDPGDRSSILEVAKEAAATFKGGGGVGYPLHLMRPMGDIVSSTGGVSSGPMSFAQIYDTVCGTIKQGGVRRGAQMAIMHAEHPDVGRFCVAKRDEENLSNFNISVGLTDCFLEAVKNDEMYTLVDPTADEAYIDSEPFETVPESIHFYDPQYEDAWNDQYNKPAEDEHGKAIQTNFWRDYYDEMGDPEAFDEFRDRIDLEVGEPLELPARFIWQLLVDGAHHLGEPGFYYIDKANDEHSFDVEENYGEYLHSTNPCGEQSLTDGEPCNLGHVNLSLMADEDAPTFAEWCSDDGRSRTSSHVRDYLEVGLDMELLEETTKTGTRFLDNVITMNDFPLEKNREAANNKRKIGVGIMGFHQLCLQLGIEYGTDESYALAEEVMRLVDRFAVEESYILADERGPFERYEDSKWADPEAYPEWFEKHAHNDPEAFADGYPVRNHNMTTVAPTGTTSMIGNTTGGCEPIYNVAYFKNVSDDVQGEDMLVEIDDLFLETIEANDLDVDTVTAEIERKLNNDEFTGTDDLETVPDAIGELFVTSSDLSVEQHIRVQAAFQTYCDSSISKTLNIRNNASLADVGEAIGLACELGCKGGTLYRIGSRTEEVKTTSTTGGGVSIKEADEDDLLEELGERGVEIPDTVTVGDD
jgi:ribonucleoside-diphosphate reductase alpha chain